MVVLLEKSVSEYTCLKEASYNDNVRSSVIQQHSTTLLKTLLQSAKIVFFAIRATINMHTK